MRLPTACARGPCPQATRPNWGLNELDFVFATLVVGSIINFSAVYLLAPVAAGAGGAAQASFLTKLFGDHYLLKWGAPSEQPARPPARPPPCLACWLLPPRRWPPPRAALAPACGKPWPACTVDWRPAGTFGGTLAAPGSFPPGCQRGPARLPVVTLSAVPTDPHLPCCGRVLGCLLAGS